MWIWIQGDDLHPYHRNYACDPNRDDTENVSETGPDAAKVAELVKALRGRRTQMQVETDGGPSQSIQSLLENARWRPPDEHTKTFDQIDAGYGLVPGDAERWFRTGEWPRRAAPEAPRKQRRHQMMVIVWVPDAPSHGDFEEIHAEVTEAAQQRADALTGLSPS